jgi:hypothetical protein
LQGVGLKKAGPAPGGARPPVAGKEALTAFLRPSLVIDRDKLNGFRPRSATATGAKVVLAHRDG